MSKGEQDDTGPAGRKPVFLYIINEAYFLLSHRSELLEEAARRYEAHVAAPADHVWAPEEFTVRQIEERGVRFIPIEMSRRGQNPFGEMLTVLSIGRAIRQTRPDILHVLTIKANVYGGVLARLLGVPAIVFSVTGLGQVFIARGVFAWLRRRMVATALWLAFGHANARIIVQNAEDHRYLIDAGIVEPDKAVLIRGAGVDTAAYQPGPESPGPITVTLASRLLWEKGVGTFVEAARLLGGCTSTLRFVIVGDTKTSNPRAVPQKMLEDWVAAGLIEWWGRRTDMPEVLAQTHIFCLPSVYGEGVPKVLLEAASAGRPIVASDIAGCREVVQPGINGLLVPPNDPAKLAEALGSLIGDDQIRRRMGRAGRDIAVSEFDVADVVEKTLTLYETLLKA